VELEDIILSEVSQLQKAKIQVFSHVWIVDLMKMQQYYEKQFTPRGGHM
jgi:hypothetical protein